MKIGSALLVVATFGAAADAKRLGSKTEAASGALDAAIAAEHPPAADEQSARKLQCDEATAPERWHPNYIEKGWADGWCVLTRDCDTPGYDTELDCCTGQYGHQRSGACLSNLPSPPTGAPTDSGGLGVWYPDYSTPWPEAGCLNTRPIPLNVGFTTFSSQLECCKRAFGGQISGVCLDQLPSPPTTSPTDLTSGEWWPNSDPNWSVGTCTNARPVPNNVGPTYDSQLACCKSAYRNQMSGACLADLPSPPTGAPTDEGDIKWFAMLDPNWAEGTCVPGTPASLGFGVGDKPAFDSQLECCKVAYRGQVSGACIEDLPNPPTTSPTDLTSGEWWPNSVPSWPEGTCTNARPVPNNVGPTYDSQLACCIGAYGGQSSGACIADLPSPPTTSPTDLVGSAWYPDGLWRDGGLCINARPVPNNVGTFSTQQECCNRAYGGQNDDACQCDIEPCYSCKCPGAAAPGACPDLTCS